MIYVCAASCNPIPRPMVVGHHTSTKINFDITINNFNILLFLLFYFYFFTFWFIDNISIKNMTSNFDISTIKLYKKPKRQKMFFQGSAEICIYRETHLLKEKMFHFV